MARVTVEDCVRKVPNRFELVMLAAQRSRDVSAGAPLSIDRDNDKNPVVALREIAEESVELDGLRDAVIKGLQKHVEVDEPEDDMLDLMNSEERLNALGTVVDGEGVDEAESPEGESPEDDAQGTEPIVSAVDAAPDAGSEDQPDPSDEARATDSG